MFKKEITGKDSEMMTGKQLGSEPKRGKKKKFKSAAQRKRPSLQWEAPSGITLTFSAKCGIRADSRGQDPGPPAGGRSHGTPAVSYIEKKITPNQTQIIKTNLAFAFNWRLVLAQNCFSLLKAIPKMCRLLLVAALSACVQEAAAMLRENAGKRRLRKSSFSLAELLANGPADHFWLLDHHVGASSGFFCCHPAMTWRVQNQPRKGLFIVFQTHLTNWGPPRNKTSWIFLLFVCSVPGALRFSFP
jgi:hypothetical protein